MSRQGDWSRDLQGALARSIGGHPSHAGRFQLSRRTLNLLTHSFWRAASHLAATVLAGGNGGVSWRGRRVPALPPPTDVAGLGGARDRGFIGPRCWSGYPLTSTACRLSTGALHAASGR